jgi:O-methyltransferase involved in polyketide biosynthesis
MNVPPTRPDVVTDPIAFTAKIVAAKRAIEQHHPTPLFEDPFAGCCARPVVVFFVRLASRAFEKKQQQV